MTTKKAKLINNFEAILKIENFYPNSIKLKDIVQKYLEETYPEVKHEIVQDTSKTIKYSFSTNTEVANCVKRKLQLVQIDNPDFANLKVGVNIKITNKNTDENGKLKGVANVQPRYLSQSSSDVNESYVKKKSPKKTLGSKSKIIESLFLDQGPYLSKSDVDKIWENKDKALWLNKKGFNRFIGQHDIDKNKHFVPNYVRLDNSPKPKSDCIFREDNKSQWVGKKNFFV